MKILNQRFEKYAERKDHEWRAKQEANGTHEDNQPSVKESGPLTGHRNSSRDMGSFGRGQLLLRLAAVWQCSEAKRACEQRQEISIQIVPSLAGTLTSSFQPKK